MKTTELRVAFTWTCEDCGRDHFVRAVPAPADLIQAAREDGHLDITTTDPGWQVAPDEVTCPFCNIKYQTEDV